MLYLGNTFAPSKCLGFLYCLLFRRHNGLEAKMEFTGVIRRTKEIEIHEEIGDDNEIRILIS